MDGASDDQVFAVCRDAERVLVTCDLDFANPLVHDPRTTSGIAVLRRPKNPGASECEPPLPACYARWNSTTSPERPGWSERTGYACGRRG